MASEELDIKQRIAQIAGQINRHKNQQQTENQSPIVQSASSAYSPYSSNSWRGSRGGYAARSRGYPYPARGSRPTQVHRHRTLVLNNNTASQPGEDNKTSDPADPTATPPMTGWVSKTDRHMQLINPAVYEKQSQARAKAIEETRKLKLQRRDERERIKLTKHLQRSSIPSTSREHTANSALTHDIVVQGILFRVMKGGGKLMKVPGEHKITGITSQGANLCSFIPGNENAGMTTPKTATVGGVTFYRSKNGNLYRSGIVKAQRYSLAMPKHYSGHAGPRDNTDNSYCRRTGLVKKIDEPCRKFSTTGSCLKGPRCRYNHDPEKVAICKVYLQKGTCPSGDSCDLSHDPTPERTPTCLHFANGNCSNPDCRYSHVHVSPSALVCRAFGIYGYCEKGSSCSERHVNECPDFSNTGVCNTKGCKLIHRHKASVIRRNIAKAEDESSDLSSDEEIDETDSDDVDSDDVEFLGNGDAEDDIDIPMQQDFVQL